MDHWETEASLGYLAEMVKKEGRQVSRKKELPKVNVTKIYN